MTTRTPALRLALSALAAAILSGCTIIRYESAGTKAVIISPAFGSRSIDSANLQTGSITGWRSEQTQMAEAIAAGVSAGLKRPTP